MEERQRALLEVRCPVCKSLLFKMFKYIAEICVEIKCRRCKTIVLVPKT